jgi:hypothetical protein
MLKFQRFRFQLFSVSVLSHDLNSVSPTQVRLAPPTSTSQPAFAISRRAFTVRQFLVVATTASLFSIVALVSLLVP